MNNMNKDRLKEFVNALDALSDDVKNMDVNRNYYKEPECGTSGSHPGLIYIVAEEVPGLKYIYKRFHFPGYLIEDSFPWYDWASTLANFLGFKDKIGLTDWAKDNPKLWGNKYGHYMFCCEGWQAFTNSQFKKLTHRDIINHWKQVLKNIENEGVKI
jgi:hypothetical protein